MDNKKKRDELQKTIDRHEKMPWFLIGGLAIFKDVLDTLPFFGFFSSMIMFPIFVIVALRCGSNIPQKVAYVGALFADSVPIIGLIPVTSLAIGKMYQETKLEAEKARSKKKKLQAISIA